MDNIAEKRDGDSQELLQRIGRYYTQMLSNNFFALDALRERFCESEAERQLLCNIYRNDLRMLRFMRRCMLYSNCLHGGADEMPNTCVNDFLNELANDVKEQSGGKIRPLLSCCRRKTVSALNERRMTAAIMSLIVNAVDNGAKEILLKLDADSDDLRISVCDSGEQADGESVNTAINEGLNNPDGSGLGLMLASMIAAEHGGTLSYKYGDDGNEFVFELPVKISDKLQLEAGSNKYRDPFSLIPVELCDWYIEAFDKNK